MNRKDRRHQSKRLAKGKPPAGTTLPDALQHLIALYEGGRLREALRLCRQLLTVAPGDEDLLHLAGAIAARVDEPEDTVHFLEAALALDPDHADAYYNLGNARRALGRLDEAIAAYQEAIRREPGLAEAHNNLGIALVDAGRPDEAVAAYRRAIELRPRHAGAHNNLAIALFNLDRVEEAEATCRQAIALMPSMAEAHNGLANILKARGKIEEAAAAYAKAIEINPAYAEAYNNLGILLHAERNLDGAVAASRRAIELMPGLTDAYRNLGHSLHLQGRHEDARDVYERALVVRHDPGIAVRRALLLPLVPDSREAIDTARKELDERLTALLAADLRLDDPHREVGVTPFALASHGMDDRPLQEKLARLYLKACPSLAWQAPHLSVSPPAAGDRRTRVGFVSRHLLAGHAVGRLFGGLVERLPRDRFEVLILRPQGGGDPLDTAADRVVSVSETLAVARQQIAEAALDVLVYPDIGLEPLTYFLAFARLAPVQCVAFGHPVTTGIPAVDGFLTTGELDPSGAEAHYIERLERLARLPLFYRRPPVASEGLPGRRALGLPDDRPLYLCPQAPFAIHPDFDAALAAILERDSRGLAVFVGGAHRHVMAGLHRRLARSIPDIDRRVTFLPALEPQDRLGLLAAADVVLDGLHVSGRNSSLEALAVGTPVVTWPSGFLRGRFTAAVYREMGIEDLIAGDHADYVERALRCAADAAWRTRVSETIRERGDAFFENDAAVAGFTEFVERAVARG